MGLFGDNIDKTNRLFDSLCKHGSLLSISGYIYFNSEERAYSASSVKKALRESGFKEFILVKYDKDSLPKDDDSVIYGWLIDHITRNTALAYERANQKRLHEISSQLDDAIAKVNSVPPSPVEGDGSDKEAENGSEQQN